MYWPYQKPKRCWKCGGNKMWIPQNNKWICPHCDNPPPMYPPPAYPQYNYPPRQPMYRGPPAPTYSRQVAPIYQPTPPTQYMAPVGNKLCIYCGATMRDDEAICPKCLQRVLIV